MVEERVTEVRTPAGETHTRTDVYHEAPRRSGAGWAIFAIVLIALVVGALLLFQGGSAEVAKDNAIADAANNVGAAAQEVGTAAQTATEEMAGE